MSPNEEPRSETLAAYLEGEVTASEAAAIEAVLADSGAARRKLDQLRRVRTAVSSPIHELEGLDLAPLVRAAARTPRPSRVRAILGNWQAVAAIAACFAGVVAGAVVSSSSQSEAEFRAKNAAPSSLDRDRWAGVQVYRVRDDGAPEPLGARFEDRDGLLFSYTNIGPHPFEYLMIFAVDSTGEVRWFHPAYESAETNPASIVIEGGQTNVLLPEVIRQDFAAGPVTVYALFTQRALRVLEVEEWLRAHRGKTLGLPVPEASLQTLATWVEQ